MSRSTASAKGKSMAVKKRASSYATYVFWIMFGIIVLNFVDRYVFVAAANIMAKELGFGLNGIGYLASAFVIVYTLGAVPLGIWADRTKRKNVVALCVTVWSLATALTALVGSFTTLFLARMVLGIGEAGYFPAGTALLSDYFSREKRARVMSRWNAGTLVGVFVGSAVGGALAGLSLGSWRLAFLLTGLPGLILAFLAWRLREPRRNQADEEEREQLIQAGASVTECEAPAQALVIPSDIRSQFRTLLCIKTLVVLIGIQVFAYFVLLGVVSTFMPTYLQQKDVFGLSSGAVGLSFGAVTVGAGVIGTLLGGSLAEALNRHHSGARVLVCGIGFLLSVPTFAVAVLTDNLIVCLSFFFLTVLLWMFYQGPSTAATQDVVPAVLRATAVALSGLIAHLLGDAFAPSVVGTLALAFDPTHGLHFQQGLAGQELRLAMVITCTPALLIAGLLGIVGARWMKSDVAAAEAADRLAEETG